MKALLLKELPSEVRRWSPLDTTKRIGMRGVIQDIEGGVFYCELFLSSTPTRAGPSIVVELPSALFEAVPNEFGWRAQQGFELSVAVRETPYLESRSSTEVVRPAKEPPVLRKT